MFNLLTKGVVMAESFSNDKIEFFKKDLAKTSANDIKTWANKDFLFLNAHRNFIEFDLNDEYAVLNPKTTHYKQSLQYCLYTATLLKNYYQQYSPGGAQDIKYSEQCDLIEKKLKHQNTVVKKATLLETMAQDLSDLSQVPFSNAKLRNLTGKTNLQRLSTRFSMITMQQTLLLARQYHYLDALERLLGKQINIAILDAPVGVYNALSVGIFGFRFLLNLSMALKHIFMDEQLTLCERFYEEIKKRHVQMTNDVIWGVVNGLSNYAAYFHIAAPVANYLLIGFTVFDVAWLNYQLYQTDTDFAFKKSECIAFRDTFAVESKDYQLENAKLDRLALAHEKARTEFIFNIAAASILLSSFTVAFLFAPAALIPVCFLISNIAIAMYLSGSQYGEYKEKCLIVEQQQEKGLAVTTEAKKDVQQAWNNLAFSVAKNTIMPLIIIGAFTVSLPAALLLTAGYVAYEMGYLSRLPELFEKQTAPAPGLSVG